jgi:dihydrofolate reductase
MTFDGVIGDNNQLVVNSKADMKFFKKTTEGNIVVMGKHTYESIGKVLPNRFNIVLTSDKSFKPESSHVYFADSIHKILHLISPEDERDIYFIGGARVYEQVIPICDEVLLTVFDRDANYYRTVTSKMFPQRLLVHNFNSKPEVIANFDGGVVYKYTK